ncbi:MAG: 3-hydroxyacyl-ACP dehydratase FabZ family protein [Phycisphaerae bacterium]
MSASIDLTSIPHRPPFLFVDEIVEVTSDRIVTKKLADPEADFFRGHYPGHPVMPGVLLCECCFQAGALLLAHRLGDTAGCKGIPVVTRIEDARFKRMVKPGEMLYVEAAVDDVLDTAYFLSGRITVEGTIALRVKFACMQVPPKDGVV